MPFSGRSLDRRDAATVFRLGSRAVPASANFRIRDSANAPVDTFLTAAIILRLSLNFNASVLQPA